ncbi:RNA polymerase sigma factor SigJ [Streptomyces thioluteus]|uniref:DNA-directed RNA polymerase sigma-70 factor n=1 Tax=Streptomyces thioluteus TaxID=66431 RepID=A0A144LIB7_STRTU|nr:DNA-directed RNA polymerase sigma-70 factor [Streptomyces thioluteus]
MHQRILTTERFEEERPRLRAIAYRMLGSVSEADDAVQETWLRLDRTDAEAVENPGGWLTTVVARVCLNMLRSRETRREDPLEVHVPDPLIGPETSGADPEQRALLADSVGLALLVVLETMSPAERVAFVLHDLFAVSFDEIAPLIDKTPAATRQLASRARRRVRDGAPAPDPDLTRQRVAVDAFFAAAHDGDFDALVAVLDPDVVLRADAGAGSRFTTVLNGARTVASRALTFARLIPFARPVLVHGTAGVAVVANGRPVSVMAFTVTDGRITTIDILADTDRLRSLDADGQMRSAAMRR